MAIVPDCVRIGLDDAKTLDEVVVRDAANVHLERMGEGAWWMRITRESGEAVVVNLWAERGRIVGVAENE